MKKTSVGNTVAADMDSLLKSDHFEKLFSKQALRAKTASASEDMACAHDCSKEHEHAHKCDEDCSKADDGAANTPAGAKPVAIDPNFGAKPVPGPSANPTVAAAVDMALSSLNKVSEVLDEAGLEKTAALSLLLAQNIIVEAKKKSDKKDDKKKLDKKLDKKDDKKDKNDAKKLPKKDEKKSDKKEDKKDKKEDKKSDKKAK